MKLFIENKYDNSKYFIVDTSVEFNVPIFDYEKYDFISGNHPSNLKHFSYDRLKEIFKDNDKFYKLYLNKSIINESSLSIIKVSTLDFLRNKFIHIFNDYYFKEDHISLDNINAYYYDIFENTEVNNLFEELNKNFQSDKKTILNKVDKLNLVQSNFNNYVKTLPEFPSLDFNVLNELEQKINELEQKIKL